jgi:GT2 family glycosyltransferase
LGLSAAQQSSREAPSSSINSISSTSHRPIHLRFHPTGTHEVDEVRNEQLRELHILTRACQFEAVLNRLGRELVEPLATMLLPAESYGLGHWAYEQERFEMAALLLKAVVAAGQEAGDLRPWAKLFLGLSRRELGQIILAREQLSDLCLQHPSHETAFHAQVALAWLNLNAGEVKQATDRLETLLLSPMAATNIGELDIIGRVLSTLEWLGTNPREKISHTVDRASSDGVVAAIDRIQLSRCGQMLQVEGWIVDPGQQLRDLFLVRGERVWRLNLGQARYSARPDLGDVLTRCGGDCNLHPGLRINQLSMPEEAIALQGGEAAELFVILSNGSQFCLRRTIQGCELSTAFIREALDAAIQEPCRLVSANLLHRARELWSTALHKRLEKSPEHKQFGTSVSQPELSVVVPLYGRVDFMEYQLNWFNAWSRRKGADHAQLQLIYVLDDPRLKQECMALAKRCNTLYSMPFELVLNPENLGFAGANNRGASFAKAPLLLLLNSDVLPAHDDSLELMLRAMQQHRGRIGALGARLLFDNGAIQHQGMAFVKEEDLDGELGRVWLNDHPLKGVKIEQSPKACQALQEVEAATAACLLVERDRWMAIGGLSTHYIVGDFEDSDFCMKLRTEGLPSLVDLAACFYHLERQSVDLASNSATIKAKLVAANAITHHQRWCSTIERLHQSEIHL